MKTLLILTRRTDETLIATTESGQEIEFTVLGVKGNQVRIGIKADKETVVDRMEVHERKQAEAQQRPAA